MPLNLGLHRHTESQGAAREARRQLLTRVKNDWYYPDAPHPDTHIEAGSLRSGAKDAVNALVNTNSNDLNFQPVAWKERTYSDIEDSDREDDTGLPEKANGSKENHSESSDTAGSTVAEKKASRKRKRQQLLEEEMTWNVGMAHFSARRNAWTAAKAGPLRQQQQSNHRRAKSSGGTDPMDIETLDGATPTTEDATVLIPIPPPLLPEHPVRTRIGPSNYSEIYSKIILQSRTPTVPINLQDITNALVHGWKEEGNWPPKMAAAEPSFAKKKSTVISSSSPKHPHLKKGVQAVSKVLGLGTPS